MYEAVGVEIEVEVARNPITLSLGLNPRRFLREEQGLLGRDDEFQRTEEVIEAL